MNNLLPNDMGDRLAAEVNKHAERLGLRVMPEPFLGDIMVLSDGRTLDIDTTPGYWRDVDANEPAILDAAAEMVEAIAAQHGPGAVWCLGGSPLVHLARQTGGKDGPIVLLDANDNPKVRLRTLHAHEATAKVPQKVTTP